MKVKFNCAMFDRSSGETHLPTGEFVEVSEALSARILEIRNTDPRHVNTFEIEGEKPSKDKKVKDGDKKGTLI